MIKLYRKDLLLSAQSRMDESEGSVNVEVNIETDESYADYVTQAHCGYYVNNMYTQVLLELNDDGNYELGEAICCSAGPIYLSLGLVKDNRILKTNQVRFDVQKSPNGTTTLPSIATWQETVSNYCNEIMQALYTPGFTAMESMVDAMEEQVEENSNNIIQNIADIASLNSNLSAVSLLTPVLLGNNAIGDTEGTITLDESIYNYDFLNIELRYYSTGYRTVSLVPSQRLNRVYVAGELYNADITKVDETSLSYTKNNDNTYIYVYGIKIGFTTT